MPISRRTTARTGLRHVAAEVARERRVLGLKVQAPAAEATSTAPGLDLQRWGSRQTPKRAVPHLARCTTAEHAVHVEQMSHCAAPRGGVRPTRRSLTCHHVRRPFLAEDR